jgi:hypothetical protein
LKDGHPFLILDFRGNRLSFFPLSMILAIGLSYYSLYFFLNSNWNIYWVLHMPNTHLSILYISKPKLTTILLNITIIIISLDVKCPPKKTHVLKSWYPTGSTKVLKLEEVGYSQRSRLISHVLGAVTCPTHPYAALSTCCLPWSEYSLWHTPASMMCCLTIGPEVTEPRTIEWSLWNHESK